MKQKFVPEYEGELRKHALQIPRCISECSGIRVFGRRIKSLVFSTDVAIIKNINADAVIAVYNFTPQPSITQAIISVSDVPVFMFSVQLVHRRVDSRIDRKFACGNILPPPSAPPPHCGSPHASVLDESTGLSFIASAP